MELAKRAEDAGFEMAFTSDDPGMDAFVSLAAMAAATSSIKIGSGICRAFIRNPFVTASASQDVDELSNGRMILGLATGTKRQNLYQYGVEVDKPVPMLREAIEVMRQVWRSRQGEGVNFQGKYYSISQPRFRDDMSVSDSVPIYIAAVNPLMTRLAGELCEGMAGHPCYTADYLKGFIEPELKKGLDKAGRDRSSFDMGRWITTAISDDVEACRYSVRLSMGNYLATRSYGSLLDFHGWTKEKENIQDAFFNKKDMNAVAMATTDEIIDAMTIYGTPSMAREQLEMHWPSCDIPVLIPGGAFSSGTTQRYELTKRIIDTFAPMLV
jgi:probable F420-dependent oxidoreductase